jgi:Tfp pilus assembly protein PilP
MKMYSLIVTVVLITGCGSEHDSQIQSYEEGSIPYSEQLDKLPASVENWAVFYSYQVTPEPVACQVPEPVNQETVVEINPG